MATRFTELTPKHLQVLQGISSYEKARRALVAMKDAFGVRAVLVYHAAQYLGVPENEVLLTLK